MIHPTATVHKEAELGKDVSIGPFSIVEKGAIIGDGTVVKAHVHIHADTVIGRNNTFFQGCSIGEDCQDLKYKGERTMLNIGDNNMVREYVTLNRGTTATGSTDVGSGNLIMAYCHIAHDCKFGNNIIIANSTNLAGHVEVHDNAIIGGVTAVHQFTKIGSFAMIGACSKVVKDVLPFSLADGHPLRCAGVNLIGLRRNSFSKERISTIKKAFKLYYFSGLLAKEALMRIEQELDGEDIDYLLDFIGSSQRAITPRKR